MEQCILQVALDTPLHTVFDYCWRGQEDETIPAIGQLVVVPFGRREAVGVVVGHAARTELSADKIKDVLAVRSQLPPLSAHWLALCGFAADYYQRPLGEVMLPGLPKNLRALTTVALDKALKALGKIAAPPKKRKAKAKDAESEPAAEPAPPADPMQFGAAPPLNAAQQQAVDVIAQAEGFAPLLLYGVTGSGKTEVYLQAAAAILKRAADATAAAEPPAAPAEAPAQILVLVPEINLTPQLEGNIRARFPHLNVVALHSGLAEGERTRNWLAAHLGQAHIVLGTRLAILSSLPHLKLIVIDEEHDPSYKQQEGLRYSARDLAVWRAHQLGIPVVLGSATPSLETWQHAQAGRYRRLELRQRAAQQAVLPTVKVVDMERDKPQDGLTSTLIGAIRKRLENGEQSLLFLNRRGYAPVLACDACGWISNCMRCDAFMVVHRPERRLRCHHCSLELHIPKSCPTCGNIDLQPLGRGTQRVEEGLHAIFPEARVLRIDADSTRLKGSAQVAFDSVHRGEVDILIGTQMVAKGHDFKKLTLVGVMNPDTALFSHDYRASERLFAQLIQVAGRAGRAGLSADGSSGEVLIQTRYPHHPLYQAVMRHDYDGFAGTLLEERQQACFPPFMYQALLRAEARELAQAVGFLQEAAAMLTAPAITINAPIPMTMMRVANVERAQLLVECPSRPALQAFLREWLAELRLVKTRVRWSLEVDPVDI
ncbi:MULTISPECIES: primosomal protein N' [unclassified Herbaspirillum]|uniref:primosomal protein N' n=1 Tax=unclassified Herbaspirillum TaxID=2624150 RepID=UPI00114EEAD5|nr:MULTISPECIES: primosomal protein N' [unclassified Herbaspirillum]MBB5390139.1 primosomal protein N' (replication factor Y) [Herbaspirillum sp. SJZ102]TQK09362.1 replication restart DNA helicase PriA [Herbaspirillum sp. SJZ130]TQK13951.1 replication restart DNA helicase PriA [Herbaspirillum sp. SJZ106]